ncbi:MAG: hypothetical protein HKM89_09550 [Gemmatimonadales bacterium]|nr:hypothetical protein [Gemmatimonadales bacterium]
MSLRSRRSLRTVTLSAVAAMLACGGGDQPRSGGSSNAPVVTARVTDDATALGQEIFELADRTMDYIGSHRGRVPGSLRDLGIDSLTPTTARSLAIIDKIPVITVEYRRSDGHQLSACSGTHEVLEQSTLRGEFTLTCRWLSGAEDTVNVSREVGR